MLAQFRLNEHRGGMTAPIKIQPEATPSGKPERPMPRIEPATDARCQIVTDGTALAALGAEWQALCRDATGYHFSQSFEWCLCGWQTIGQPRGRTLHTLIMREDGQAVLIWPMVLERRHLWSILRPLGSETTEYSRVLVADRPDAESLIAEAWRILRRTARADVAVLHNVQAGTPLHRVIAADRSYRTELAQTTSSLQRADYRDWDSYYRTLSKSFRSELGRKRRRLAELGAFTIEQVTRDAERGQVLDWLLQHKLQWLARTGLDNPWLATAQYRDFLRAIIARPSPVGEIVMFAMRLDGRIVGAQLCGVDRVRLEGYIGAFDGEFGKYSPGQILLGHILKWAFECGLDIDFRIGDQSYKRSWINRESEAITYEIADSPRGALYIAARRAERLGQDMATRLRRIVPATWRQMAKSALRRNEPHPRDQG